MIVTLLKCGVKIKSTQNQSLSLSYYSGKFVLTIYKKSFFAFNLNEILFLGVLFQFQSKGFLMFFLFTFFN